MSRCRALAVAIHFSDGLSHGCLLERWLLTPPLRSSTLVVDELQDLVVEEVKLSPDVVVSASRETLLNHELWR